MKKVDKTAKEILEQPYLTAYDLQVIIPSMSYARALEYIKSTADKMKDLNYYVPDGKTKVALTRLIKKDLGL